MGLVWFFSLTALGQMKYHPLGAVLPPGENKGYLRALHLGRALPERRDLYKTVNRLHCGAQRQVRIIGILFREAVRHFLVFYHKFLHFNSRWGNLSLPDIYSSDSQRMNISCLCLWEMFSVDGTKWSLQTVQRTEKRAGK